MKNILIALITLISIAGLRAQYEFTNDYELPCTSVKSQDNTGTCWSFSTVSFLESEVLRLTGKSVDLSEMAVVNTIYKDKANNYVLRQGKAQFGEGGLSHDVTHAVKLNGLVPESAFSGNKDANGRYNHAQLVGELKGLLDSLISQRKLELSWRRGVNEVIDEGVGMVPGKFEYEGQRYSARSFADALKINPDDYITFTSFAHHPFYTSFILEIPDNYSNGTYYNVPMQDLYSITTNAVQNGFSVAWDADVSERGFNARLGIAVVPAEDAYKSAFKAPVAEQIINQKKRQAAFESYETTDDHLMHIVGMAHDQRDTPYFIVKNSWGEIGPYKGNIYVSKPYFDYKTIAVMVHKDAVPDAIKKRFGL